MNNDFGEQLSLFSLISWDYIRVKSCVIRTQPLLKEHVSLIVLTANLLLILAIRKNIVRSDEMTSGEECVGVLVPARRHRFTTKIRAQSALPFFPLTNSSPGSGPSRRSNPVAWPPLTPPLLLPLPFAPPLPRFAAC